MTRAEVVWLAVRLLLVPAALMTGIVLAAIRSQPAAPAPWAGAAVEPAARAFDAAMLVAGRVARLDERLAALERAEHARQDGRHG